MLQTQQRAATFTPPAAEMPYYRLKSRQEELQNQLENVTEMREDLARDLQGRQGTVDREGLEARIKAHDARLQQLDADLAQVGKELAANAPASLTVPPIRTVYRGYGDEDMVGAGFIGASVMLALMLPFLIRSFRRRRYVPPGTTSTQLASVVPERIDRMEQAIDSIAVEIERVSENQRFMTRLMTETQLAGTLAAVRGSAEAAKAAAETSNV